MITENFGVLPTGEQTHLYTISCGKLTASITDYGASLVRLFAPDRDGNLADIVLGYDNAEGYRTGYACLGGTIGRNSNRIKNAAFSVHNKEIHLAPNEKGNNLHSGPKGYHHRLWKLEGHSDTFLTLRLDSPNGDQVFPGKAVIHVTYALEHDGILRITYDAISDADTVFNLTNHSYFNLAGHDHPDAAINQLLTLPSRFFTPADEQNIPTGETRSVAGTPMDFRCPKPIGQDIHADYLPLYLQKGYDHNFEVFCSPCAILQDPGSGRTMAVTTDCPGIQVYAGNFLHEQGKNGIFYAPHSGIALETQFYPDSVNHPQWKQPIVKKGEKYRSATVYRFTF